MSQYPRIGIGIMVHNEHNHVLLGMRIGAHGENTWCFPGGQLEWGETIFSCAKREVKEECGLTIEPVDIISVNDDMEWLADGKHYITICVLGKYTGGEPKIMEPHRCAEWKWFPMESLPENIFSPTMHALKNLSAKKIYQYRSQPIKK